MLLLRILLSRVGIRHQDPEFTDPRGLERLAVALSRLRSRISGRSTPLTF
jgi:hypothetical protein